MKIFIPYEKIPQFPAIVKHVTHDARYDGKNEDGTAKYNNNVELPKINITLKEKIHGANGAVSFNNVDGFWVQSRKKIIYGCGPDNAGCAFTAEANKDVWLELIGKLSRAHKINLDTHTIVIYFEWSGGSIQKKSAITGLEKRAILFEHFKTLPLHQNYVDGDIKWYQTMTKEGKWVSSEDHKIYNIMDFKHYNIDVDFANPKTSINEMVELVDTIERNSPVGTAMGKDGNIGEGVVGSFMYKDQLIQFKVKGDAHANSKVTKLKEVDMVKEQVCIDFANKVCSASRLEQMFQEVFGIENEKHTPNMKHTKDFLNLLFRDILSEESDTLSEMGLIPKDVGSKINQIARVWFQSEISKYDKISEIESRCILLRDGVDGMRDVDTLNIYHDVNTNILHAIYFPSLDIRSWNILKQVDDLRDIEKRRVSRYMGYDDDDITIGDMFMCDIGYFHEIE